MNTRTNCTAPLNSDLSFCDVCGTIINLKATNTIECELHPVHFAVGFCVICRKPVCEICMVKINGRVLCSDSTHHLMLHEWQIVCRPESEYVAESIVCNLKAGGIDARTFSLHDHISARDLNESRVLVFVRKSEIERAFSILRELNLIDED